MSPRPDPPTSTVGQIASSTHSRLPDAPTQGSSGNNNTLYLFTFLTTLLLLLGISCAIIFRSIIIRRRFRQRLEEALARGTPLPDDLRRQMDAVNTTTGNLDLVFIQSRPHHRRRRRRQHLGPKPVLWQVSLGDQEDEKLSDSWDSMSPISSTVVHKATPDLTTRSTPSQREDDEPSMTRWQSLKLFMCGTRRTPSPPSLDERPARFTFSNSVIRPRPVLSAPPSTTRLAIHPTSSPIRSSGIVTTQPTPLPLPISRPPPPPPPVKIEKDDTVTVGFVIAMPDPARPLHRHEADKQAEIDVSPKGKTKAPLLLMGIGEDGDEELPEIVFGVRDVRWMDANSTSSKRRTTHSFDSISSE